MDKLIDKGIIDFFVRIITQIQLIDWLAEWVIDFVMVDWLIA